MNRNRVRELRKNLTDSERFLWKHLRLGQMGGYKFRRQQPIGEYVADFVCLEKRLIVEVDGGQHSEKSLYDSRRDEWLKAQGLSILKFWNNQVLNEIEAVKKTILRALLTNSSPPTLSSPARGEDTFKIPIIGRLM